MADVTSYPHDAVRLAGSGLGTIQPGWYALEVKSRHEKLCAAALATRGFERFLPLYRSQRRWSDRNKVVELPLISGYVFCRFEPRQRSSILATPGVRSIVSIGHAPAQISDSEIESLERVVNSGSAAEPLPFLEVGHHVRIIDGPLRGLEGILMEVRECLRLVVSVTLLRRSVSVEVDRRWVEPVTAKAMCAGGSRQ